MSCPPSTTDSTERNWMPRFSATDAMPPVRQLPRPTRRYSIGVMPSSVAAKTSGWSASNVHSSLWLCSSPRPKKLCTLIWLSTPLCHLADARQVNWAASGAPFRTSRASSSACTLTPLVTVVMSLDAPSPIYPDEFPMGLIDNTPAATSYDSSHVRPCLDVRGRLRRNCRDAVPRPAEAGPARLRPGSAPGPGRVRDLRHPVPRAGQRHPGVPCPQRRRSCGRLRENPAPGEHPRRLRRHRPRWLGRPGARLVGRDDRTRQGVRHRPVLRRLH